MPCSQPPAQHPLVEFVVDQADAPVVGVTEVVEDLLPVDQAR
jgi:hypothetical protein